MIIYFHGFGGHESTKADDLRRLGLNVVAPTYRNKAEFITAANEAISALAESRDPVQMIVGLSLGGFLAYYLSACFHTRGVLVNPCLDPVEKLTGRPGMTEDWLAWMKKAEDDLKNGLLGRSDAFFTAIVNSDDEVLGDTWRWLPEKEITHIIEFDKGGHQATNWVSEIAPRIKELHDELAESVRLQSLGPSAGT